MFAGWCCVPGFIIVLPGFMSTAGDRGPQLRRETKGKEGCDPVESILVAGKQLVPSGSVFIVRPMPMQAFILITLTAVSLFFTVSY